MASVGEERNVPDPFIIVDEDTGTRYYGGNQAWFPRNTQTYAGCGVVASANAMRALLCKYPKCYEEAESLLKLLGSVIITKAEYISVISDMYKRMFIAEVPLANFIYDKRELDYGKKLFKHIPPSLGMSASSVVRGLLRYAKNNGVLLHDVYLSALFVEYEKGLDFIKQGLERCGAVVLLTSFNRHPLTLYRGKAGDIRDAVSMTDMRTHFATITDVFEKDGEPVIKLSTWGRVATIPYKKLHESWQKRRAYVSALFYFVPERSRAMYRADMRKTASFTPVSAIQTVIGRRLKA